MPRAVNSALALLVIASAAVFALPRDEIGPGGVVSPPTALVLIALGAVAALVVGALLTAASGQQWPSGQLLLVAGALVSGTAAGSAAAAPFVRSAAVLVAALGIPSLVQVAVSWPKDLPASLSSRRVVGATWGLTLTLTLAWLLAWDPFSDRDCRLACDSNPFAVVHDASLARGLQQALLVVIVCVTLWATPLSVRPGRLWPAGLAALLVGADAAARLVSAGPPSRDASVAFYTARCAALIGVGLFVGVHSSGVLVRRGRLHRLAASLDASPAPGTYAASLAAALHDRSLDVAYALSGREGYAHADGSAFAGPGPRQAATRLVRDGVPVAIVVHQPEHAVALSSGLGEAARMAIDNERLQAELYTKLGEVRVSRARIVERSDLERLRLERDLHDGAQQYLLMLGHELRRACRADQSLEPRLEQVTRDVDLVLHEVREIAHGIYPGVLESLGLRAALDALTDGPVPMTVRSVPAGRLPQPVERTAYRVVVAAVATARDRPAGAVPIAVAATADGDWLRVAVEGVAPLPPWDIETLEDHVLALGGTLTVGDRRLDCDLPCASS